MITRLFVHNFRCFENFALDLAGRPSALLIGRNGSGKSTVLHAFELIQKVCRGATRVNTLVSESDFAWRRTDRPMRFEIEATLADRRFKYELSFDWPAEFREARVLDEGLAVDGTPVFGRHHSQVEVSAGGSFLLDRHVTALPIINERPGERAIRDFKAFVTGVILIAPIPSLMKGYADDSSAELQIHAENFAGCLHALLKRKPAAYGAFASHLQDVIPDFSSVEFVERGESGHQLMVKFARKDPPSEFEVDFKMLSAGEKCYFLSAYVVAANEVGPPVVCVWDEPDNHLSLAEVGQFIVGLRKLTKVGRLSQFLATSHHPETIRKFSDETTLVLTRRSHLEPAVVRPLGEIGYDGDLINALIRGEVE